MGDTIWVDIQGRAEEDLPPDNSIMLRFEKPLERLSAKLGVAKLTDFYDYSAMEQELADFMDEEDADEGEAIDDTGEEASPQGTWFVPAPALAAVCAIHDHLVQYPEDLGLKPDASRKHWPAELMEELKHCRSVLEGAAAKGRKFRFLVVS